jgi:hypothetical protein
MIERGRGWEGHRWHGGWEGAGTDPVAVGRRLAMCRRGPDGDGGGAASR